jgi:hypothetical protein
MPIGEQLEASKSFRKAPAILPGLRIIHARICTVGGRFAKNRVRIRTNAVHLRTVNAKRAPRPNPCPTFGRRRHPLQPVTDGMSGEYLKGPPRSQLLSSCPTGHTVPPLPPETDQSIAVHTVDCERGNASEDSQRYSRPPAQTGRCGPAPGTAARYTAAHPARHSYISGHLAETPHAQPLPGSDA